MSHPQQKAFCLTIKDLLPNYFSGVNVLDVGSLDINGNNRYLFDDCEYTGIDLGEGPNVDKVCLAHEFTGGPYDTIISTEMLEHDIHYQHSLLNMVRLLKPGGLLLLTCATTGRMPHGIELSNPADSPFTHDYYQNVTEEDICEALPIKLMFSQCVFTVDEDTHDLYFWGVKRGDK